MITKKSGAEEVNELVDLIADENGNLHVKNLSAFWIPELTTTEKVGHTTYTVTGSWQGVLFEEAGAYCCQERPAKI